MTSQDHDKLEELFTNALKIDTPADRYAYLDEVCGTDSDLRKQVDELLSSHDRVGTFLESPPIDIDSVDCSPSQAETPGTIIGRYKLLREIGEGGFGTVHEAEQAEPVRRKVALKIIKLGMDTKQVIARFEVEQQALALMDHPNIARVFDAGATERGRPYFVMELVKGIKLTDYCDQNKLTVQQRLELFLPICQAVQHAHQKGIIHRDLKPSNVLVALHANQPVPKVIDFGIAKATSQRLTEKTLVTEFRQFLGTPEYMSPDQAEISGLDMDTRTDVYSLGVMVYELLTSVTPFSARMLRKATYEEIRKIIRDVEPPTPSARFHALRATQAGVESARLRQAEPALLERQLRGDLDWIVMKAMEKDRTRRYATAKDLADDIGRYLRHEPVMAGPPGVGYKFRKFVRRHRVGVLTGALVVVALLVGLSLATVGLVQAKRATARMQTEKVAAEKARTREREQRALAEASTIEALRQVDKSEKVSRFLEEMLRSVNPNKARGREVTVRYLLDEAVKEIDAGAFAKQPEVEADLRMTLGETYKALGLYSAAGIHLRAARALWSALNGDRDPDTLRADRALAGLLRLEGKYSEAEALLRETAESQERVLGSEDPETLVTKTELALALWGPGRFAEAERMHREILRIQKGLLGERAADTVKSLGYLGAVCRELGRSAEAETLLLRALDLCRPVLGEDHPFTGAVLNNLGLLLEDRGHLAEAEENYRQAYELYRRVLGVDHPRILIPLNDLLRILRLQKRTETIGVLIAERMAYLRRVALRPGATALALHAYAWELLHCEVAGEQDPKAALRAAERAVDLSGGRDATIMETLAQACQRTGDLERAIETQIRAIGLAHPGGIHDVAKMEAALLDYRLQLGDITGAIGLSWDSVARGLGRMLLPGVIPDMALDRQAAAHMAAGRFVEAEELLRGCLSMRRKALPEGHWLTIDTQTRLAIAVAGRGDLAGAETLMLDAYGELKKNPLLPVELERQVLDRIIRHYETWQKADEASRWRKALGRLPVRGRQPLEERPEPGAADN